MGFRFVVLIAGMVLGASSAWYAATAGADEPRIKYDSPQAVFEGLRKAAATGDVRAEYFCYSPALRDNFVFESSFALGMRDRDPKAVAVLNKYGGDEETLKAEYFKRYAKKHGVDLNKLEKITSARELPPRDDEVSRDAVVACVTNKVEFVVAAAEVLDHPLPPNEKPLPPTKYGRLSEIEIHEDRATARVNKTSSSAYLSNDGPMGAVLRHVRTDEYVMVLTFRKVDGEWLIEKEEPLFALQEMEELKKAGK